jgi:hypothetical protein
VRTTVDKAGGAGGLGSGVFDDFPPWISLEVFENDADAWSRAVSPPFLTKGIDPRDTLPQTACNTRLGGQTIGHQNGLLEGVDELIDVFFLPS